MNNKIKIFISTGEASGDNLAFDLMTNFLQISAKSGWEVSWSGMAGKKIRDRFAGDIQCNEKIQSAGLFELLPKLKSIREGYKTLVAELDRNRPDLAVLVDFPDFNLKLAQQIRNRGIPLLYYVAPQCWAWRQGRAKTLQKLVDKLAVLFPFEKEWFAARGIESVLVEHPLIKSVKYYDSDSYENVLRLGIFPGSRKNEIEHILPVQLKALKKLRMISEKKVSVCVVCAAGRKDTVAEYVKKFQTDVELVDDYSGLDLAWCAAGTVTLELAIRGIPFIVTHKLNEFSYQIARRFVNVPYLAMPNLLLNQQVAPELVQNDCNVEKIVQQTNRFVYDGQQRYYIKQKWKEVSDQLSLSNVDMKIEQLMMEMINDSK